MTSPAGRGTDPLHRSAAEELEAFDPPEPWGQRQRQRYLQFLGRHPDGVRRSCLPEHLTASALLVDATGERMLLTLHRKGGFWAQLGGHCEAGDASLADAALREASEESGIEGLRLLPGIVDLDRHELSGRFGSCRAHWDVRYVAVAPEGAVARVSAESRELRWFPLHGWEAQVPPGTVVDLGRLVSAAARVLPAHLR